MIVSDACGTLDPQTDVRHSGAGSFTATTTGPVPLEVYNWRSGYYTSLVKNYVDNIRVIHLDSDFTITNREIICYAGGTSTLNLDPGIACAGKDYIILSGATGTWPGSLVSGITVPLNTDAWTWVAYSLINTPAFSNFMGKLDAFGNATARIDTLGPLSYEVIGHVLHFDYLLLENPGSLPAVYASDPVYLLLTP